MFYKRFRIDFHYYIVKYLKDNRTFRRLRTVFYTSGRGTISEIWPSKKRILLNIIDTESDLESFTPCYCAKHNRFVAIEVDLSSLLHIKKTT